MALFDSLVAGDDASRLRPAPDPVCLALEQMKAGTGPDVWRAGDSTIDITAAAFADLTRVFLNRA